LYFVDPLWQIMWVELV